MAKKLTKAGGRRLGALKTKARKLAGRKLGEPKRKRSVRAELNATLAAKHDRLMGGIATLRDLVREADAAGCTLDVSLDPVDAAPKTQQELLEHATRLGPKLDGRFLRIGPVPGREVIFGSRAGGKGIVVEVMIDSEGQYVFELSHDGKVIGTTLVAAHLQING